MKSGKIRIAAEHVGQTKDQVTNEAGMSLRFKQICPAAHASTPELNNNGNWKFETRKSKTQRRVALLGGRVWPRKTLCGQSSAFSREGEAKMYEK